MSGAATSARRGPRQWIPRPLSTENRHENRRPLPLWARACLAAEVLAACVAVTCGRSGESLPSQVDGLRRAATRRPKAPAGDATLEDELSLRLGHAVHTLTRWLPASGPCLVRSLVLTKLLARRNIPTRLVIGVCAEPSFSAHAWVEKDGQPLLPTDPSHRRLAEL